MGKKDKASWEYFQDETRVADMINTCCYGGAQIVKPEDVRSADSRNSNGERDVIRKTALGNRYVFIGIENQDTVDHSLPVRIMGYDYGDYKRQVDKIKRKNKRKRKKEADAATADDISGEILYDCKKTDKISPVVTIVLYYGDDWDGPKSVLEMTDADHKFKESGFLQDYRINLINVSKLSDEELDKFRTDIKQVFKFIKNRKDREKMAGIINNDPYYKNVEKTAHGMMKVYGGLRGYNIKEQDYRSNEGGIDMCKAWDDQREEGRAEGIDALNTLILGLIRDGRSDEIETAAKDKEYRDKLMQEYQIF